MFSLFLYQKATKRENIDKIQYKSFTTADTSAQL